jgi:hypothetical protein
MGGALATRVGLKRGRGRGNASRLLAMPSLLWQEAERFHPRPRCCSSSVVEHSLGKGEVESSILSCSTIHFNSLRPVSRADATSSYQVATAIEADWQIAASASRLALRERPVVRPICRRAADNGPRPGRAPTADFFSHWQGP